MKGPRENIDSNKSQLGSSASDAVNGNMIITAQRMFEREVDFSEYEWMGEEMEEFDRKCIEELLEEAFIEAVFEDMLEEEEEVRWLLGNLTPEDRVDLVHQLEGLSLSQGEDSCIPEICILPNDDEEDLIPAASVRLVPSSPEILLSSEEEQLILSSSSEDELYDDDPEDR